MFGEYEVHANFNIIDLISFVGEIDDEAGSLDLRSNHSQEGRDDEITLTKGLPTRVMTKRIQEDWASSKHVRPKLKFTWDKEDVKT